MIVSTTLAGHGSASLIHAAIATVAPFIDAAIVIDTVGDGACFQAAHTTGVRIIERAWPWRDDFAAARNAALDFAADAGAEWSCTLDLDERMSFDLAEIEEAIATPVGAWMVRDQGQHAVKERLIRVPSGQRWHGLTHECYYGHLDPRGRRTLERSTYWELPKTDAQNLAKFIRDERLLLAEIEAAPDNSRHRFYLGVTLRGLGRLDEAVEQFKRCAVISQWPEEAGWSCWEAANLLHILGRNEEALQACASGLMRYPGIAELCWTAARCSIALGRRDEATDWAKLARVHGHAGDGVALRRRILWRVERALGHGPDEILSATM